VGGVGGGGRGWQEEGGDCKEEGGVGGVAEGNIDDTACLPSATVHDTAYLSCPTGLCLLVLSYMIMFTRIFLLGTASLHTVHCYDGGTELGLLDTASVDTASTVFLYVQYFT
jgi:hypothetical protein